MDFLRRPIHELTFDDVSAFCERSMPEGIQLDYKKELSYKGLSKHFAAFSNARGGLIIVGVEEGSNGKPIKWEGLEADGKLEDRIHQYASNVDPLPRYEVHTTNPDDNGKIFLLIRIFEGDRTPYYVINDANIHMRTGNITKQCLELASPHETARLFEKRETAKLAQQINIEKAERVYKHVIERFHKQEKKWHKANLTTTAYHPAPVPTMGVCTTLIQPQFPNKSLISTPQLRDLINKIKLQNQDLYWSSWSPIETIQEGILITGCQKEHNAKFTECQEILASGLIFGRESIDNSASNSSDHTIGIERIIDQVYYFLTAAREIYISLQYQGGLTGYIQMSGLDNLRMKYFGSQSYRFQAQDILLPSDRWDFETDTSRLFNKDDLKDFFIELVSEIIWSFGWSSYNVDYLRHYIGEKGWFMS